MFSGAVQRKCPGKPKGRVLMIRILTIRMLMIRVLTIRILMIRVLTISMLTIDAQGSRRLYVWR